MWGSSGGTIPAGKVQSKVANLEAIPEARASRKAGQTLIRPDKLWVLNPSAIDCTIVSPKSGEISVKKASPQLSCKMPAILNLPGVHFTSDSRSISIFCSKGAFSNFAGKRWNMLPIGWDTRRLVGGRRGFTFLDLSQKDKNREKCPAPPRFVWGRTVVAKANLAHLGKHGLPQSHVQPQAGARAPAFAGKTPFRRPLRQHEAVLAFQVALTSLTRPTVLAGA